MKKILVIVVSGVLICLITKLFIPAILPTFAQTVTNLISNGNFESDFTGWTQGTGVAITSDAYEGVKAARFTGTTGIDLRRRISGQTGKTYKVTMWVKINPGYTGNDWGGFRPRIDNWAGLTDGADNNIGTDNYLTPQTRPVGSWFKESFFFTVSGTATSGDLVIGSFGGGGWTYDVEVDDVKYFEVTGTLIPPTASISSNTQTVATLPGTVTFTSVADDPDGGLPYYHWDFGDGGHSNASNPTHQYIGNGSYIVKLTVVDDSNLSATAQIPITVSDPTYPAITITSPTQTTISSPTITVSGIATGGSVISKVDWSTDRGMRGTATGTSNWNLSLDLTNNGGKNRLTVNAYDSSGKVARKDLVINYLPTTPVTITNGASGVTQNNQSIEEWDKFEATFTLQNSVASNPYIPYETSLPGGMVSALKQGISVDGIFTSPSGKVAVEPGFYYQPYTRNTSSQTLVATGNPVWKIRYAPLEKGVYTYQIRVTDDSGTTTISDPTKLTFTAVTPTNTQNHGFLKVSQTDKRYFEFSDGTPFIGVGPGANLQGDSFQNEAQINKVGLGSGNYTRTWISGYGIAGSSWVSWGGGLQYDGNVAGNSLTTDEAYGDGVYSFTLPDRLNSSGMCSFYGFQGTKASLKPNTNYRILIRLKTVGITGTGGFTFRPNTGWPNNCNYYATQPLVIPYQKGSTDWHVVTATWNSGNTNYVGDSLLTLENVTGGRVYIDEISMREDLGNGQVGPEVLPRSKVNVQDYFSQEPSWNIDLNLDQSAAKGMYQKLVISEKQDTSYNSISPYGLGYDKGGQLYNTGAPRKYQEYYWRYLTARYGYSRGVHSWEYANEQGPGDLLMARALASYMHTVDPNRHMANQSPWCCVDTNHTWDWGEIDFAVSHAYVANISGTQQDTTSWLGITDPNTGGSMVNDTALYITGHSLDVLKNNWGGNKPFDIGEAGVIKDTTTVGQNDTDTKGVWLHQFIWPQMNPGGVYFTYWWDNTINSNNLYPLYTMYRKFMEGQGSDTINKRIPLNNGKYADIQLTLPTGIRGWGQKDVVNGGAHFWAYDQNYTWVTPTGGASLANKTFSFSGLPAKQYIIEFWDTWTGAVTTQNLNFSGGTMTLTVPSSFTQKDIAIKVIPSTGYPASTPGTQPNQTDINKDGKVDVNDLKLTLPIYMQSTTCQTFSCDINADGKVNTIDSIFVLKNF